MTYAKPLFKTYNHVLPQNKWCRNSDFILSLFSTPCQLLCLSVVKPLGL